MATEEQEREIISLGAGSKTLLEDEAFNHVVKLLEKSYWEEFKTRALTPEARTMVQAKAKVLDDVRAELHALANAGYRVELDRQRRLQREELSKKPTKRV